MSNPLENVLSRADIYSYAIRLLSKRDYSEYTLRRKLQLKSTDYTLIDEVISKVKDLGYQSDLRYIKNFISYAVSQKKGPVWIRAKLKEKGLHSSAVEGVLSETTVDWELLADELLTKKFNTVCIDHKEKNRRFRFLIARGYESSVVIKAIERQNTMNTE